MPPNSNQIWQIHTSVLYLNYPVSYINGLNKVYLSLVDNTGTYLNTVVQTAPNNDYGNIELNALISTNGGSYSIIFQSQQVGNYYEEPQSGSIPGDSFAPGGKGTFIYGHFIANL